MSSPFIGTSPPDFFALQTAIKELQDSFSELVVYALEYSTDTVSRVVSSFGLVSAALRQFGNTALFPPVATNLDVWSLAVSTVFDVLSLRPDFQKVVRPSQHRRRI